MTWLDSVTLETVVVHTASASFKGVRAAVHDDCLVLRDAMILEPESQELLQGFIVIPRENVLYLQIVSL